MAYAVGDIVKLRKDLEDDEYYGGIYYYKGMGEGEVELTEDEGDRVWRGEAKKSDCGNTQWHEDMFEKPKFKVGDKLFQVKDTINPEDVGKTIEIESIKEEKVLTSPSNIGCVNWTMDYLLENFELAEKEEEERTEQSQKKLIIHCPTQDLYNRVLEKLERESPDLRWRTGQKPTDWRDWHDDVCLKLCSKDSLCQGAREGFEERYEGQKITSAEKYLGDEARDEEEAEEHRRSGWYDMQTTVGEFPAGSFALSEHPSYEMVFQDGYIDRHNKANKIKNKTMSVIKNAFKPKVRKALDYFELANGTDLNDRGRAEFVDFLYKKLEKEPKEFNEKIMEAYDEEKDNN